MQQKEVLACRGAGCNVTGVAKRWDTAETLSSFWIPIYKYTGTTGQLVALQHSCKEGVDGVSASVWTPHAQECNGQQTHPEVLTLHSWHSQEQAMEHQKQYLCHWWLCCFCLSFKIYWSAFFFPPRLQCWLIFKLRAEVLRKAALTGELLAMTHCVTELITQGLETLCWTWAASQPLNIPASPAGAGKMDSTFPPTAPCTFPSRRSLQFGSWLPVKAKATHKGINQQ